MFSFGAPELLVILVIVLLFFGGKRLPQIGSALGKSIREFKKATGKDEISGWIKKDGASDAPEPDGEEQEKGSFQSEVEKIPGVKEVQDIKETAGKIKAAGRFFLRK